MREINRDLHTHTKAPHGFFALQEVIRISGRTPPNRATFRGMLRLPGTEPRDVAVKWMGSDRNSVKFQSISHEAYWIDHTRHLPGAPQFLYTAPESKWYASNWLAGRSPASSDLAKPHVQRWAAEALARLHETPVPSDVRAPQKDGALVWDNEVLFARIRQNFDLTAHQKKHLQTLQELSHALQQKIAAFRTSAKVVHSDAKPANCLLTAQETQITFIDFEDADLGDPLSDIAFFSLAQGGSMEDASEFLRRYHATGLVAPHPSDELRLKLHWLYRFLFDYLNGFCARALSEQVDATNVRTLQREIAKLVAKSSSTKQAA